MSNALGVLLRRQIAAEGPIPVAHYMTLCLSHPEHGYYMTRDPLGRAGDFVTAPEVSQMFGELLGLWVAQSWADMGAPASFTLLELGPGRGTLMSDALRALRALPGCRDAATVRMVEISRTLRAAQKAALADQQVHWHDSLTDALDASGDAPVILLANEFLDALPIHQLVKTPQGWRERRIGLVDDSLAFTLDTRPTPLEALVPSGLRDAPRESLCEVSPAVIGIAGDIARHIAAHGGTALFVDYGHALPGLGETLQAVRAHRFAPVLETPGESDLTAHVDFASLADAARSHGAAVDGPTGQGAFLQALGIAARAARLEASRPDKAGDIAAALHRLTAPDQMGSLFKVLAIRHPDLSPRPGFAP